MRIKVLGLIAVFAMLVTAAVAHEPSFEITIPKTTAAPVIDGVLDDAVWQLAPTALVNHINDDVGTEVEPEYVATAMAAYDGSKLYVAFRNGDPNPGAIVTAAPGHDQDVWADDENEMFIEPNHAGATPYFHVMINAANTTQDSESGGADSAWEPNLESAVVIGADYWSLEVAIPFADLGISGSPDGETWGWNFNRHIMSGVDLWVAWATTGAGFHTPDRFGHLIFGELASAVKPSAKLTTCWGSIKQD